MTKVEPRVRIGVAGVGSLGQHHVRILQELPEAELVGFYDVDPARSREIQDRFGVPAFDRLESLLNEVDALSCVVPTTAHFEVGRQTLEHDIHLFLEKPMTETVEEAETLIQIARQRGLKLQVGHVERFNPAFQAVYPMIQYPRFVEIHRLAPFAGRGLDVDVILDLMIHDLDLVLALIPSEPVAVDAVGVPVLTGRVDLANARIQFAGGERVNVTASRTSFEKMRKIRVFKEDLYASVDLLARDVELFLRHEGTVLPYFPPVDRRVEPLKEELRAFLQAILHDTAVPVSGEQGLRALRLAMWVREEVRRNLIQSGLLSQQGETPA